MSRSMIARQNIKLNLVPGGVPPVLNVSQYDSAYDVHFTIYNGAQLFEIPDDVSIQFQETKCDGNGFTVGATKSAQTGQCYIWMQEQMSAVPGDQICELVLTNTTEDQIGTANFIMRVEPAALNKSTVISESEIAYANQVLAQLGSVAAYKAQLDAQGNEIDQLNTDLAAEVAARQAADNTLQSNINSEASTRATADAALQSQINQLVAPEGAAPSAAEVENARVGADGTVYSTLGDAIRGQVTDVKTAINQNNALRDTQIVLSSDKFAVGTILYSTGFDYSSSSKVRIASNVPDGLYRLAADTGYEFGVYLYQSGTYVGCVQTDGTIAKAQSVKYFTEYTLNQAYDTRVVLKRTDNGNMTVDESAHLKFFCMTDTSLSKPWKAADAKAVGERLGTVDEHMQRLSDIAAGNENEVIFYQLTGTEKLIAGIAINGSGAETTSSTSFVTDFIPIGNEENQIYSEVTLTEYNFSYYHYVAFYDTNKGFISREGGLKNATINTSVPSGTKYIRTSLTYVGTYLTGYSLKVWQDSVLKGSPRNKWYVLGDSISAGYYSMTASMAQAAGVTLTYNSPVTTEGGEATGSVWDSSLAHNYWGYANKWYLKRTLVGKAYPGQGYFHTAAGNSQNGVYVVTHNDFSDAGLITVAWGFNDWHYNMARGNHDLIDASVPYPGENYDTTQITTVNQAIWFCLGELIRQAPNAKIVVQTPMNGWAYGGDWSTNWGIGYAMSNSGKLSDIHDDIVYWADYYGLQVLDMTYGNSIVNRRNIKDTIIDGSHPSDAAHQQLGRTVAVALKYC